MSAGTRWMEPGPTGRVCANAQQTPGAASVRIGLTAAARPGVSAAGCSRGSRCNEKDWRDRGGDRRRGVGPVVFPGQAGAAGRCQTRWAGARGRRAGGPRYLRHHRAGGGHRACRRGGGHQREGHRDGERDCVHRRSARAGGRPDRAVVRCPRAGGAGTGAGKPGRAAA